MNDYDEMLKRLNEIQSNMYINRFITEDERMEWYRLVGAFRVGGKKLGTRRLFDGKCVWYVKKHRASRRDNIVAEWVKYDPPKNIKCECTTRCLFFVFDETIPYNDIRERQNHLGRVKYGFRCKGWNYEEVWGKLLTDNGFVKIRIFNNIRRDRLAVQLKGLGKIATHSSHHLASIFDGKVYDSWNSSLGRVDSIYIRKEYAEEAKKRLGIIF